MEQGKAGWTKTYLEDEGGMGNPYSPAAQKKIRDLALFNIALDSKLRGCDVVKLMMNDVLHGGEILSRSTVMQ